ncbi:glycoside hydrolase family 3 protein [Cyathus striatus]|nr:glycoside hydrolase family 3 protein [Cyathus striatus]
MAATFDVEATLAKLTLSQKIKLLAGQGWWQTEPIPEAGVPSMRLSDGPNGVLFNGVPSSCFPCSAGLGSSFDTDLARSIGEALGDEARAKSTHVLLAPTVNTQRSPLGGRSFESFSEDPHLNGIIAAAYINGVQAKGVSATIKHYVANDQEFQSERALREIYLKPFQIAIKKSNPWALMSAYNRVNGTHVSENKWLLDDILRKEWGYQGMIMSDWIGVYSTTESIKAGLDLEMPGPTVMRGRAVERALIAEKLFPSDIDARVHKKGSRVWLLRTAAADATVLLKNDKKILPLSPALKTIAVIGPNAKQAMTSGGGSARLLSSYAISPLEGIKAAAKELGAQVKYAAGVGTNKYLPLADPYLNLKDGKPTALFEFWNEPPSTDFTSTSTDFGTSLPSPVWSTTTESTSAFLTDGIFSANFIPDEDGDWEFGLNIAGSGNLFLNGDLVIDLSTNPKQGDSFFGLGTVDIRSAVKDLKAGQVYNLEIRLSTADFAARGSPFTCWGGIRLGAVPVINPENAIRDAVDLAKITDGKFTTTQLSFESEGFDRQDLELPGFTNLLVTEVLKANPNAVVVNQSGSPVSMPWIDEAATLVQLQAFYGGNELGNGLADILFGKVNPSGKLSLTFPKRLEDTPSYPSYGDKGQEHGKILYNEGVFVGYRSYEKRSLAPLFPFGYGLSYTGFKYSDLKVSDISATGTFNVTFKITNAGNVYGKEIAQIYISDVESSLPRPLKELKGFVKVELTPGETKSTALALDKEALSFYDDRAGHWIAEKGSYTVQVGSSSADIRLQDKVELSQTITWKGL